MNLTLANALIVAPDRLFRGAVVVREGRIADLSEGRGVPPGAVDCEGDYVIPGLVELHTDNLERHLRPRPGAHWPRRAAVLAHDGEFATCGVTTVCDALRLGMVPGKNDAGGEYAPGAIDAIARLTARALLRADHFVHLRCEISADDVQREVAEAIETDASGAIRLISLMDHTPGQRQFATLAQVRQYNPAEPNDFDAALAEARDRRARNCPRNRDALAAVARAQGFYVASHDDAETAHVEESAGAGASIAEFPTTIHAARESRARGIQVMMGAPNLLRGGSHSGNASALDLANEGLVDLLSSDYAPASLMLAAFKLGEETDYGLPRAIRCVTSAPARAIGLTDRGDIAIGQRADLARVYRADRLCVARGVWKAGARIA